MAVKPRNSPNLQACETGDKNESEEKEIKLLKKEKLNGRHVLLIISSLMILGFVFYLGTLMENQNSNNNLLPTNGNKMNLKINWKGGPHRDKDACVLLSQCFTVFQNGCEDILTKILKGFDNGFYYEGSRLVGFISANTDIVGTGTGPKYGKIFLYNVCIRKEDRGKKIGKLMVPEFIKEIAAKRITKIIPKTFVGLDVDFETETSVSAFTLYAKLGFNRWWQFCENGISHFDFKVLEGQEASAEGANPIYNLPMAEFMLGGKRYIESKLKPARAQDAPPTHLCMVMLLGQEDFSYIGKNIKQVLEERK